MTCNLFCVTLHKICKGDGTFFNTDMVICFQKISNLLWEKKKYCKVVRRSTFRLVAHLKDFQTVCEGESWRLFTLTFGQKGPKLNNSLVYFSRIYGIQVQNGHGVLSRQVSCMGLACWVLNDNFGSIYLL